jgi:outer membrane immunogenic protein
LHAGYNWQFAPAWVVGIEGDWTWTKAAGTFTQGWTLFETVEPVSSAFTAMSMTADWLASIRARLGFLVAPNILAYVTGGGALGKFDYAANNNNGGTGALSYITSTAFSSTSAGYVVGGGLE